MIEESNVNCKGPKTLYCNNGKMTQIPEEWWHKHCQWWQRWRWWDKLMTMMTMFQDGNPQQLTGGSYSSSMSMWSVFMSLLIRCCASICLRLRLTIMLMFDVISSSVSGKKAWHILHLVYYYSPHETCQLRPPFGSWKRGAKLEWYY